MPELRRRLAEPFQTPHGVWEVYVIGHQQPRGSWQGFLEFARTDGTADRATTGVETTQPSEEALLHWASALTQSYFDGAFDRATRTPAERAPVRVVPREWAPELKDVETFILDFFRSSGAVTIHRETILNAAKPYSNAEIVRAIADLEMRWRLLYRFSHGGRSWLTLTKKGFQELHAPNLDRRKPSRGDGAPEIIYERPHPVRASDGRTFNVAVLGVPRLDGTWSGWVEFSDGDGEQRLRTDQETSQPDRTALEYWASGVEDVYLEGALGRAHPEPPE